MSLVATAETCPPVFATPLTAGRPNLLNEARNVARMLGFILSPWQERFLALATEYEEGNPVDGIVPYWRYLTLTIARQCGKSECVCTILFMLRWMGFYKQTEDPKMVYTAHSIEACTDMWDTKAGRRMMDCKWGRAKQVYFNHAPANFHMRLGKQNRSLRGGRIRILSNSGKSGRGGTEDMVVLDEAREFGDDSSREKTLDPLMNMRPSPQFIITSTMGVEESGYFNRKVHAGRETVLAQRSGDWPSARLAYCEWGVGDMKPDDYDPADKDLWLKAHPMLGHGNWNEQRMAEKYDMARAEDDLPRFQQEYLNQMFVADEAPAVPWEMLDAVEHNFVEWSDLGDYVVLGVFSEPGAYYLSAVAAGNGYVKVVRPVEAQGDVLRTPTYTCSEWLDTFLARYGTIRQVVYLEGNDLETMLAKYKKPGVRTRGFKFAEYKDGCRLLKKALVSESVSIQRSTYLRMAVAACEVVMSADQSSWYWAKKRYAQAGADELRAAVLAWKGWHNVSTKGRPGVVVLPDLAEVEDKQKALAGKENRWAKIYGQQ